MVCRQSGCGGLPKSWSSCGIRVLRARRWGKTLTKTFFRWIMVNVNLVCQSVPKEPLQARVSKGAVATAITACGFVTFVPIIGICFKISVATAITACGFVTIHFTDNNTCYTIVATAITACGFVTRYFAIARPSVTSCNSDYRLRFCNSSWIPGLSRLNMLQQRLPLAVL